MSMNESLSRLLRVKLREAYWDDVVVACLVLVLTTLWVRNNRKDPYYHLWFEHPQAHLKHQSKEVEDDIGKHLRETSTSIVIFYGSQSGTSQRLAQSLSQTIDRRFSQKACVASLSDYSSASIARIDHDALAIFILSTYGEGDPPDNAYDFADWLQSDLSNSGLAGLRFAMLGIGSSNYKWYNQFARNTYAKLCDAGASPVMDLSLADDAQGMVDEGYFCWSTKLFECFVSELDIPEQTRPYEPSLNVHFLEAADHPDTGYTPVPSFTKSGSRTKSYLSSIRSVPIVSSYLLTQSVSRQFVHLDLDISEFLDLKYVTGDHVAVWPQNDDHEVEELRLRLGIPKETALKPLEISKVNPSATWSEAWNSTVSLDALFKAHLDIVSVVSRELLQDLRQFAPTKSAVGFLDSVSKESNYLAYRSSKRLTLASVLKEASPHKEWNIPLSFVLERLPALRPRYYSISSASSAHPRRMSLTLNVKTIALESTDDVILGTCSHYLYNISNKPAQTTTLGSAPRNEVCLFPRLWCQLRRSSFKLPASLHRPTIMIATGSGIAPFRGFIQHAVKQFKLGHEVGQMVLLFGCRRPEEQLYGADFEAAQAQMEGKLRIMMAYSRYGDAPCHVQDTIMKEPGDLLDLLLEQDASMYICGSAAMARAVNDAMRKSLGQQRNWPSEQWSTFEAQAKRSQRWQEDVWG